MRHRSRARFELSALRTWGTRFVALALFSGCSPLEAIVANTCGNGVVEKGEDCDRFVDKTLGANLTCAQAADPNACHYVCVPRMSNLPPPDCPHGWSCGLDGVCRFASGDFEEPASSPLVIGNEGFELGDLDGDGRIDLVTWLGSTIDLRYGSKGGGFVEPGVLEVDLRRSAPIAVDVEGTRKSDILVPSDRGLVVARGDRATDVIPIAFSPFDMSVLGNGMAHARIAMLKTTASAPGQHLLWLFSDGSDFVMTYNRLRRTVISELGGLDAANIIGPIAVADLDGDGNDEMALAFKGLDEVLIFTSECGSILPDGSCGGERIVPYKVDAIQAGGPVQKGVRFADVDGDGFLDVLVSGASDQVDVAFGDGLGGFASKDHVRNSAAAVGTLAVFSPAWPIAVADLNGDGKADFVDSTCVYFTETGSASVKLVPTCVSQFQAWTEAVIGDYDRDGFPDVAASSGGNTGIDVLFGTGTRFFNRTRVETIGVPSQLRTGDFNGDRVTDIAFIETFPTAEETNVSASVMYGNLGGPPSTPVSMGRFSKIDVIESGFVTPFDLTSDLAVAAELDSASPFVPFSGTSQRRMLAPLTLARPSQPTSDVLRALFLGRFAGMDDRLDALMFGTQPSDAPTAGTDDGGRLGNPGIWIVKGAAHTVFDPSSAIFVPGAEIMRDETCMEQYLPMCGPAATGDLDGDRIDDLVTINPCLPPTALRLYHVQDLGQGIDIACTSVPLPDIADSASKIELADVDADGNVDVILTLGASANPDASVLVFWGTHGGMTPFLPTPSMIQLETGVHTTDATTLNADADPQLELAILTDAGVFLVKLQPSARTFGVPRLVTPVSSGASMGSIRVADVDADGLVDLIASDGQRVRVFLSMPHGQEASP